MLTKAQIQKAARLTAQVGEHDCRNSSTLPRRSPKAKKDTSIHVHLVLEEDPQTGEMRIVRK